MLQITNIIQRSCRNNGLLSFIRFNNFSSSSPELKNTVVNTILSENTEAIRNNKNNDVRKPLRTSVSHNSMVAAAFASLSLDENISIKTPQTDGKLSNAENVEELLSVSEGSGVSRRHALKVVSILADWSSSGKVNISDFENDPRFVKLCRILTKTNGPQKSVRNISRSEDLSTVLSVTADDEAAKMIDNITLPQMVKVMTTLSQKRRRSTLLLRSLSYNITRCTNQLNLKQCSDLLFSMSTLNYPDDNLLSRIAGDIAVELEKNIRKSSVVGSILTSIGLLKYKNPALLDILSEWIQQNQIICRPQDIFSLLMTLAVVDYIPNNSEKLFEILIPQLTQSEAGKPIVWLEIVWSLILLNKANISHISSVLDESFLSQLEDSMTTSTQLKLLNIDGAAQYLLENYKGPRIPSDSPLRNLTLPQSKDKQEIVTSVLDTLKNLIQSEKLIQTRINTKFGFYIDAECVLDKKCSPLPLDQVQSNKEATRVAILTFDYHDMCRGKSEPTGTNNFATRILEAQGYKILTIPFTEFKPREKLVHKVQYLETKLKEIVK